MYGHAFCGAWNEQRFLKEHPDLKNWLHAVMDMPKEKWGPQFLGLGWSDEPASWNFI